MADSTIKYLDYAGLQELVTKLKACDAVVKAYAGNIDGKKKESGEAYTSVQEYLEDQIQAAAASSQAKNVTVEDTAEHFTATNVEDVLAEIATTVETINGDATTEGSFKKAIVDAIGELKIGETTYSTVKAYVDAMVVAVKKIISNEQGTLTDLTTDAKDTLVAAINEVDAHADTNATAIETLNGDKDTAGSVKNTVYTEAKDAEYAEIEGTNYTIGIFLDAVKDNMMALKSAAYEDVHTGDITKDTTSDGLVSAAQVDKYVQAQITGLTGAMHFTYSVTPTEGQTDVEAIEAAYTAASATKEKGDFVVITTNSKEYVYDGTNWVELGDESLYVTKATTIAGVDLQDNITKDELLTALNVADGAEVNAIESVDTDNFTIDTDKKLGLASGKQITTTTQVTKLDAIDVDASANSITDGTDTITIGSISTDDIDALFE